MEGDTTTQRPVVPAPADVPSATLASEDYDDDNNDIHDIHDIIYDDIDNDDYQVEEVPRLEDLVPEEEEYIDTWQRRELEAAAALTPEQLAVCAETPQGRHYWSDGS